MAVWRSQAANPPTDVTRQRHQELGFQHTATTHKQHIKLTRYQPRCGAAGGPLCTEIAAAGTLPRVRRFSAPALTTIDSTQRRRSCARHTPPTLPVPPCWCRCGRALCGVAACACHPTLTGPRCYLACPAARVAPYAHRNVWREGAHARRAHVPYCAAEVWRGRR